MLHLLSYLLVQSTLICESTYQVRSLQLGEPTLCVTYYVVAEVFVLLWCLDYWDRVTAVDVNGDGSTDLVFSGITKPNVYSFVCNNNAAAVVLSPPPGIFTSDAKTNLLMLQQWAYYAWYTVQCIPTLAVKSSRDSQITILPGDFNGDCRTDLMFVSRNWTQPFACTSEAGVLLSRYEFSSFAYNITHKLKCGNVGGASSNIDTDPDLSFDAVTNPNKSVYTNLEIVGIV